MLWLVTQRFHFTGLFFFFFASVLDFTSWPERLYCPSCASIRTKQVLSRLLSGQCWVRMKILCTLSFPHDTLCIINPQVTKAAGCTPGYTKRHIMPCRCSACVRESVENFSSSCGHLGKTASSSSGVHASRQSRGSRATLTLVFVGSRT